jgi:hypothetical protein
MDHYTPEQRITLNALCAKYNVIDQSHLHNNPPDRVPSRKDPTKLISIVELRGKTAKVRDTKVVNAIGYHQMAVNIGVSAQQLKAAGGDRFKARNLRAKRIAAHMCAFRDGTIIHNFPFLWHVYHGNGLNPFSYGLELEGIYDGDENLDQTTDATMERFRDAVRFIVEFGAALGSDVHRGLAHRQVSKDRIGDPGAENWKEVALWAEKELGVYTEPNFTLGSGSPIPNEWDPREKDPYRRKK